MENANDALDIINIDSIITDTHGDDMGIWNQWFDLREYTYFQWIVFVGIILVIFIGCFCMIYCCFCRATDSRDPYKNVDLSTTRASSRTPVPLTPIAHDIPLANKIEKDEDIHWVEC